MSSDVISITELRNNAELQLFAEKQNEIIIDLKNKLQESVQKAKHLEKLLKDSNITSFLKEVSAEEMICKEQIEILRIKSADRELSLEEAKKLDLFVKNLTLIRESASKDLDIPNLNNMNEDDLVAIARRETTTD